MKSLATVLAVAAFGLAGGAHAQQQPYPSKPVTIVVPFAPGGISDSISRLVGQELSKKWGQPVVIENRAGGQTSIGTSYAARAPADGYTILYISYSWSTNPFFMKGLPYKDEDFAPVSLLGRYPLALFTRPGLPRTLPEFVDHAKRADKPISFGNAGIGSSSHLAALEFSDLVGIKSISVPYKAGTISAINDLIGGQIDGVFEGRLFKPYVDDQRLNAVVLAQPTRLENWSDLPSAAESGYAGLDIAAYFGLMLPRQTPADIQDKLAADLGEVLRDPEVSKRLLDLGLVATPQTPAEFTAFLKEEQAKLRTLVERHQDQMQ